MPRSRDSHQISAMTAAYGKGESGQYFLQEADLNVGFGDHRIDVADEFTVEYGDQRQIGGARGADRPILRRKSGRTLRCRKATKSAGASTINA